MGDLEVETKINSCLETRPFGRTKGRRSLNQQRGGTSSQGEGINNKQKLNQIKLTRVAYAFSPIPPTLTLNPNPTPKKQSLQESKIVSE